MAAQRLSQPLRDRPLWLWLAASPRLAHGLQGVDRRKQILPRLLYHGTLTQTQPLRANPLNLLDRSRHANRHQDRRVDKPVLAVQLQQTGSRQRLQVRVEFVSSQRQPRCQSSAKPLRAR